MSVQQRYTGPYKLLQCLGKNQRNEVWKAMDIQRQRFVAINFLSFPAQSSPDSAARFLRETQALKTLQHPFIAPILAIETLDAATVGANVAIVMEYVDGISLSHYLQARMQAHTPLAPNELIRILAPISDALDYTHQQGVIHGLLKPSAIVFKRDEPWEGLPGKPYLVGFGFHNTIDLEHLPLKDICYLAPEVLQGYTDNVRSDLYATGILLYETCAGRLPFVAEDSKELLREIQQSTPPAPTRFNPGLSPDLTAVIMRALAHEPAGRFSSAWAMLAAIARALQVSLQYSMQPQLPASEQHQMSTQPLSSHKNGSGTMPDVRATPVLIMTSRPVPDTLPEQATHLLTPDHSLSGIQDRQATIAPVRHMDQRRSRPVWHYAILITLVIAVLGASTLAIWLLVIRPATLHKTVGRVFFVSSGLVNTKSNSGITDRIQIELQQINAPQNGKSLYAWLLSESASVSETLPVLLGALPVKDGKATLTYEGNAQNSNLLSAYSRFLITEEDAAIQPTNPSLDTTTWRYYAEISHQPLPEDSANRYSLLDHIRHLLAQDPKLASVGLVGGLDTWLFRNTLKIMEWSGSARDSAISGNGELARRHMVRILDYLLGSEYVVTAGIPIDLPPLLADPDISRVALLTTSEQQNPTGYLKHIGAHLGEIAQAPDVTASQKQLAMDIHDDINNVQIKLEQVRDLALALVKQTPETIQQADSLSDLNTLFTLAHNAFVGEINPDTNQIKEGVAQIHYKVQALATLEVLPCTSITAENTCR